MSNVEIIIFMAIALVLFLVLDQKQPDYDGANSMLAIIVTLFLVFCYVVLQWLLNKLRIAL